MIACKSRNSTPELKDPIYGDLVKQYEESNREIEALKKDLEGTQKSYENADLQNGEIKTTRGVLFGVRARIARAQQKNKYLELSIESRKEFARKSYNNAFDKNEDWPSPEELRLYKVNQRLVNAPNSYDETHKRRLQERAPAQTKKQTQPSAHE